MFALSKDMGEAIKQVIRKVAKERGVGEISYRTAFDRDGTVIGLDRKEYFFPDSEIVELTWREIPEYVRRKLEDDTR